MVIGSPGTFVRLCCFVADRRQVVGFELWLWQLYVEVQQFEIPVLIDNPIRERLKGLVEIGNFGNKID